jgi:hypothetical protein
VRDGGGLDGGDSGDRIQGAAGAPAQRAAPVGRSLVLEPPLPAAGGRVLQPGQFEREAGSQRDLDQPTGPAPARVAMLADAAEEVVGPAPVVAGVLTPTALALEGRVLAGGRVAEAQQVHPAHRARPDPGLGGDPGPQGRALVPARRRSWRRLEGGGAGGLGLDGQLDRVPEPAGLDLDLEGEPAGEPWASSSSSSPEATSTSRNSSRDRPGSKRSAVAVIAAHPLGRTGAPAA